MRLEYDEATSVNRIAEAVHENARAKGFWPVGRSDAECVALIHSEVSELLEGLRHGNPPSDHIPDFSAAEEECADVLIRVLDLAGAHGWRVGDALLEKHKFNLSRPTKHGKAF